MRPSKGCKWLLQQTDRLIREVYIKDLLRDEVITRRDLKSPDDDCIRRLLQEAEKAIRKHRLYPTDAKHNGVETLTSREWQVRAELPLFRSKRAKQLARLLKVRQVFLTVGLADGMTTSARKELFKSGALKTAMAN